MSDKVAVTGERTTYLGDGVYARYDGNWYIWLAVNDHANEVLAIEPKVLDALLAFAKRCWGEPA